MIELLLAHSFYDMACCEDKHCRPVPCEQIIDTGNGWDWQGHKFSKIQLKPSPDGNCHVCLSTLPLCIYLPSKA